MNHHPALYQGSIRSRKSQKGQSLIEYVIYIGLAALVLVGIIYFATTGRKNSAIQSESSTLTSVVGATQKLYNADPTAFANVTAAALINNGVIPPADVIGGTSIVSGFGTPITVAPDTLYQANDSVSFTYGVPQDSCSAFVLAVNSDFAKISVGGTIVKNTTSNLALSAAALGTACQAGAGNIPVIFTATR
jgi:hypothetical protein